METKSNVGRRALWLGLAGVIITLLSYFALQETEMDDYTPEDLFAANFSIYPNEVISISDISTDTSLEQAAFLRYEQSDFSAAVHAFDTLMQTAPQDDWRFYQSIVLIATDRNTEAILHLSQIVESQQTQFMSQAEWYLALAYLKIGADDAAKALLEKLAAQDGGYQQNRSKAILELL